MLQKSRSPESYYTTGIVNYIHVTKFIKMGFALYSITDGNMMHLDGKSFIATKQLHGDVAHLWPSPAGSTSSSSAGTSTSGSSTTCKYLANFERWSVIKLIRDFLSGSPVLLVIGGGSCSEGRGFKSQHHIPDGHFVI